jgi:hypothetical protein
VSSHEKFVNYSLDQLLECLDGFTHKKAARSHIVSALLEKGLQASKEQLSSLAIGYHEVGNYALAELSERLARHEGTVVDFCVRFTNSIESIIGGEEGWEERPIDLVQTFENEEENIEADEAMSEVDTIPNYRGDYTLVQLLIELQNGSNHKRAARSNIVHALLEKGLQASKEHLSSLAEDYRALDNYALASLLDDLFFHEGDVVDFWSTFKDPIEIIIKGDYGWTEARLTGEMLEAWEEFQTEIETENRGVINQGEDVEVENEEYIEQIFTQASVLRLWEEIKEDSSLLEPGLINLDNYESEFGLKMEPFGRKIRFNRSQFVGDRDEFNIKDEFAQSFSLAKALPDLLPFEAACEDLWVTLCFLYFPTFCQKRWPSKVGDPEDERPLLRHARSHWFCDGTRGLHRDNALSRLWWFHHVASKLEMDTEESLKYILHNSDYTLNLLDRRSLRSSPIIEAVVRVCKESENKFSAAPNRSFMKEVTYINRVENLAYHEVEEIVTRLKSVHDSVYQAV